jgi:hypothetical protein
MSTKLNREERTLWSNMKLALKAHNSYDVRKEYYPLNMESWEKEHNEIEEGYRTQLEEMIALRLEVEAIEAEENAKMEAANALIMMNKRKTQKRKEDKSSTVPRRSSRISARM